MTYLSTLQSQFTNTREEEVPIQTILQISTHKKTFYYDIIITRYKLNIRNSEQQTGACTA